LEEYLIIDGYNVINSWQHLIELKNDNLELARDKLIETLQNFQGMQSIKIIVVFDAYLSKSRMRTVDSIGGVKVIYTKTGETADALIERMIDELPSRSKITVVTNDWNEQKIILGKGALRMTSRELLYKINTVEDIISTTCKNTTSNSSKSLEARLEDDVKKKLEEWRRKSR
jgi:predicted RNA-binding protein with PIN domain